MNKDNNNKVVQLRDAPLPFADRMKESDNGGSGGDGMDELLKRVAKAEDSIAQIKVDLAKLSVRSEEFATKSDLQKEMSSIHKEISAQTKWIAATIIGTAGIALAVARFLFV
ncbi:hemolysin XhlA [Pectobacterium odoriferum]|uniref:hemolysin XhlA n=2 Tax=Pectobacterium TaxID=122277 RepID=UPI000A4EC468|nr:hemolysin XhlA [Pectobacterium odoriferum]